MFKVDDLIIRFTRMYYDKNCPLCHRKMERLNVKGQANFEFAVVHSKIKHAYVCTRKDHEVVIRAGLDFCIGAEIWRIAEMEENLLCSGMAMLHPVDNFNKMIGKKVALMDALAAEWEYDDEGKGKVISWHFDKATRTSIWTAFQAYVDSWEEQSKRDKKLNEAKKEIKDGKKEGQETKEKETDQTEE